MKHIITIHLGLLAVATAFAAGEKTEQFKTRVVASGLHRPTGIAIQGNHTIYFTEVPTPGVSGMNGGSNSVSQLSLFNRRITTLHTGEPEPVSPLDFRQAPLRSYGSLVEHRMGIFEAREHTVLARRLRRIEGDYYRTLERHRLQLVDEITHRDRPRFILVTCRGGRSAQIVPCGPYPLAPRQQRAVSMQPGDVGLVGHGREYCALGGRGVFNHGKRLVAMTGQDRMVVAFDRFASLRRGVHKHARGGASYVVHRCGHADVVDRGRHSAHVFARPAGDREPLWAILDL